MFKSAVARTTVLVCMSMLASIVMATASAAASPKSATGPAPVEGTDYQTIDTPDQPTGAKVQVTEVFGYGCHFCAGLQPDLVKWKATLPSDVQFNYLPAPFGGFPDEFMHAFYAAQAMGVEEKSHDAIFKAVFVDKHVATADDIPKIYTAWGLDPKVFASTMHSFAVAAKVKVAIDQAARWGIDGTPTIVVDGKYRVQERSADGAQAMFRTVEWLVARQRPLHAK